MKELLKVARASIVVAEVHYVNLKGNAVTGLRAVIPAIHEDVKALDEDVKALDEKE